MGANKYEALLLAVELGGITRAAEALGVTQSAVSHMISSLEEELGFALLRRSRFGAQLTEAGAQVAPAIRGIVSAQERLSQTAAAVRGLERGTVRIGTFSSVGVGMPLFRRSMFRSIFRLRRVTVNPSFSSRSLILAAKGDLLET